jgi:hypothetical protein
MLKASGLRGIRFALATAIVAGTCIPASLAATAILGMGAATCAEFGKTYAGDPTLARQWFESWLQGYLSGINTPFLLRGPPADLRPATFDNEAQWNYFLHACNQRPLEKVLVVALEIYDHLREAQSLENWRLRLTH